jgi:hypothetical protein
VNATKTFTRRHAEILKALGALVLSIEYDNRFDIGAFGKHHRITALDTLPTVVGA